MQLFVQDTDKTLEGYGHNGVLSLGQGLRLLPSSPSPHVQGLGQGLRLLPSPHVQGLERVVQRVKPLFLQAVWSALDVPDMENDTRVLLDHPDQTKVERVVPGGEESDVGGAFEEGEGGVDLECRVQLGGGHLAEEGGKAATAAGTGVQDALG